MSGQSIILNTSIYPTINIYHFFEVTPNTSFQQSQGKHESKRKRYY